MLQNTITPIPHAFKSSSRYELVQTLRRIANDPDVCDIKDRSQRDIARELGISESTWKRARGVGGEWHKVDIYFLLKFISVYSTSHGVALVSPHHADCRDTAPPQYAAREAHM